MDMTFVEKPKGALPVPVAKRQGRKSAPRCHPDWVVNMPPTPLVARNVRQSPYALASNRSPRGLTPADSVRSRRFLEVSFTLVGGPAHSHWLGLSEHRLRMATVLFIEVRRTEFKR